MTYTGDLIDAAQLSDLIESDDCRVVDCRHSLFDAGKGRTDFLEGHIPGAVHADMDKDLASEITPDSGRHPLPDSEKFMAQLGAWGIDGDTHVVCYDYRNGALAVRLWWMLKFWLGHNKVSVLDGGIAAWQAGGGALQTDVVEHPGRVFVGKPDTSHVATTADIVAALAEGRDPGIVDARDAARFSGEKEPIDAVAGHIPGAKNLPLDRSLTAEGYWRDVPDLRQIWQEFEGNSTGPGLIAMCGSGVTASHLILSARLAGVRPPRLYIGSWSEWIRDESRPVAKAD